MNNFGKFFCLILAAAIANVVYKLNMIEPLKRPSEKIWWGPGEAAAEDQSIIPFKIAISQQVLDDLKYRLKNAKNLVPPLEGIQQQYGMNSDLLKEIVDFWITKYNWREREKFLNQYPQFKTKIQGLNIHYLHVKPQNVPKDVKVLPLLLLHGWPGSVREFYEIIPYLTTVRNDKDFVFEVVVPSVPGYGFSQAAAKPGFGTPQVAVVFNTLMGRLGFESYYVQGGCWGSFMAKYIAIFFPGNVKGLHSNVCFSNSYWSKFKLLLGSFWPNLVVDKKNEHRLYPLTEFVSFFLVEFSYMHMYATKPDTIGAALSDSPVGLAAQILEKFTTWTNSDWRNRADGGLLEKFTYEKLLDNVMIYWVTNSITSSLRLYADSLNRDQNVFTDRTQVAVPTACAVFDKEVAFQPSSLFSDRFTKLVQVNEYSGGHFAAFEVPEVLAKDIWLAVSKFEKLEKGS